MTIFWPDLSNNNWSSAHEVVPWLEQCISEGFGAIVHKVSEGSYYRDPYWPIVRDWCHANNIPVLGYHYVTTGDADAQVSTYLAAGGEPNVMFDFEANSGGIANFWNVAGAFSRRQITARLNYLPHWYWQGTMGSPSLAGVAGLAASSYVNNRYGYASAIYPGDNGFGWAGYGGIYPDVWQFSDQSLIAGKNVDVNAFRGTPGDLATLFGTAVEDWTPVLNEIMGVD